MKMDMKIAGIVSLYLGMLAVWDLRNGEVPVKWLVAGGLVLAGMGALRCMGGELQWTEVLLGMLPGTLMLIVAWQTKKAGYADGIVLLELGVCLGYRWCVVLLCLSMLLLALTAGILLILRKVQKNTQMPYLPFLFVAFGVTNMLYKISNL